MMSPTSVRVPTLLQQISDGRGGVELQKSGQSLGYDVHTQGPAGETFEALTFSSPKNAEIAASKITWIKGGTVERSNGGRTISVKVDRL